MTYVQTDINIQTQTHTHTYTHTPHTHRNLAETCRRTLRKTKLRLRQVFWKHPSSKTVTQKNRSSRGSPASSKLNSSAKLFKNKVLKKLYSKSTRTWNAEKDNQQVVSRPTLTSSPMASWLCRDPKIVWVLDKVHWTDQIQSVRTWELGPVRTTKLYPTKPWTLVHSSYVNNVPFLGLRPKYWKLKRPPLKSFSLSDWSPAVNRQPCFRGEWLVKHYWTLSQTDITKNFLNLSTQFHYRFMFFYWKHHISLLSEYIVPYSTIKSYFDISVLLLNLNTET